MGSGGVDCIEGGFLWRVFVLYLLFNFMGLPLWDHFMGVLSLCTTFVNVIVCCLFVVCYLGRTEYFTLLSCVLYLTWSAQDGQKGIGIRDLSSRKGYFELCITNFV